MDGAGRARATDPRRSSGQDLQGIELLGCLRRWLQRDPSRPRPAEAIDDDIGERVGARIAGRRGVDNPGPCQFQTCTVGAQGLHRHHLRQIPVPIGVVVQQGRHRDSEGCPRRTRQGIRTGHRRGVPDRRRRPRHRRGHAVEPRLTREPDRVGRVRRRHGQVGKRTEIMVEVRAPLDRPVRRVVGPAVADRSRSPTDRQCFLHRVTRHPGHGHQGKRHPIPRPGVVPGRQRPGRRRRCSGDRGNPRDRDIGGIETARSGERRRAVGVGRRGRRVRERAWRGRRVLVRSPFHLPIGGIEESAVAHVRHRPPLGHAFLHRVGQDGVGGHGRHGYRQRLARTEFGR